MFITDLESLSVEITYKGPGKTSKIYVSCWNKGKSINVEFSFASDKDRESVVWRCSVTKLFSRTSQNSDENTCNGVLYLLKSQSRPATLITRDSIPGVSLWILENSFYTVAVNNCFQSTFRKRQCHLPLKNP